MKRNIILHHTGTKLPDHLFDCVAKIKKLSDINVYLLTDNIGQTSSPPDVECVNVSDFKELLWLEEIRYFDHDSLKSMWRGSCFRLMYIEALMKQRSLENVLHFDNDVMLFEKPEVIIEKLFDIYSEFAVTAHNKDEVVLGMSYFKSASSLKRVNDFMKEELNQHPHVLYSKYDGFPNEMRIISNSGLCEFIPILPTNTTQDVRYSYGFEKIGSVFDPSSYGQYIDGTFSEKTPGWFGVHQEIGSKLSSGLISVSYEDGCPYVTTQGKKIKINNLHIHSKRTKKFL